jgi:hypothetical protein
MMRSDREIVIIDPYYGSRYQMQINETWNPSWDTGTPSKKRFIDPGIKKILKDKGYRRLGSGADAVAYEEPGGEVLKIFKTNPKVYRGYSDSQYMCIDWIKYCQKNSKNKFLPHFSGWETFEFPPNTGEMYLQIRMEKLGKFPLNWKYELAEMAGSIDGGITLEEYLNGRLPKDYNHETRTATLVIHLGMDDLQALWNTMKELNKICYDRNWNWDLHSGNFMIRSDGTPVIIDPYFLGH